VLKIFGEKNLRSAPAGGSSKSSSANEVAPGHSCPCYRNPGTGAINSSCSRLLADATNERRVSVVSLWEIGIKVQSGKLPLPAERDYYEQHLRALRALLLAVEVGHVFSYFQLPLHHRDPFDRLLIAQARVENLTLVTRDPAFSAYDVKTIW
jgi:PIN domain nuclease of toxin-antitoxin system